MRTLHVVAFMLGHPSNLFRAGLALSKSGITLIEVPRCGTTEEIARTFEGTVERYLSEGRSVYCVIDYGLFDMSDELDRLAHRLVERDIPVARYTPAVAVPLEGPWTATFHGTGRGPMELAETISAWWNEQQDARS